MTTPEVAGRGDQVDRLPYVPYQQPQVGDDSGNDGRVPVGGGLSFKNEAPKQSWANWCRGGADYVFRTPTTGKWTNRAAKLAVLAALFFGVLTLVSIFNGGNIGMGDSFNNFVASHQGLIGGLSIGTFVGGALVLGRGKGCLNSNRIVARQVHDASSQPFIPSPRPRNGGS